MGSESESLTSQVATLIRRRGTGNGQWSRRMFRQETSEIQDEPRADLTPFLEFLSERYIFIKGTIHVEPV
jgi:hypothetical protein